MYLAHFKLSEKPFLLNTDPRFLWLGREHQEAMATLRYGFQENKGLLLLTGDIGTGKTTLISALVDRLSDDGIAIGKMPDPGMNRSEFFFHVANSFGIQQRVHDKETFTQAFGRFLESTGASGKKALLIIDEAQIMSTEILEEVRLLSNMECRCTKLLNIFLLGQNELNQLLLSPQNRAIRERITISYNLQPLSEDETAAYISHRLRVAGAETTIFTNDAVREIHAFSNGSPRRINILCDLALVFGFEQDATQIDGRTIAACKERVCIPNVPAAPPPGIYLPAVADLPPEILPLEETSSDRPASHRPRSEAPPIRVVPPKPIIRTIFQILLALLILLPASYLLYAAGLKLGLLPAKPFAFHPFAESSRAVETDRWLELPPQPAEKAVTYKVADGNKPAEADRWLEPPPQPVEKAVADKLTDENKPAEAATLIESSKNLRSASSEAPDPAEIINWLLHEKHKGGSRQGP